MKLKHFSVFLLTFLLIGIYSCSNDDNSTPDTIANPDPDPDPEPEPDPVNNAPEITAQGFVAYENVADTDVIGIIEVTDADGDALTFSITDNDNDLFEISDAGVLSLATGQNLDFETITEHTISVTISDGVDEASAEITITVENVIESLFEDPGSFITKWSIPSDGFELEIGLGEVGDHDFDFTIDWGDGTVEEFVVTDPDPENNDHILHAYATAGEYLVAIKGDFPAIKMSVVATVSQEALIGIEQWGSIAWKSFIGAFRKATNLSEYNATDIPDLSNVQSLEHTFAYCENFNGDIGDWDVSNITNMGLMFYKATSFNQDISSWDTSNVEDMRSMFVNAYAFNQDISGWDTSKVTNMTTMFYYATAFNQDISQWDVSKVTSFKQMLEGTENFDQNLGAWVMATDADMTRMLYHSGLSIENYSSTLVAWAERAETPSNITLGAEGLILNCEGQVAKTVLEGKGWIITDDGTNCP
ncbi:BspA family leucine-rich repeat surface protein [Flagellimonas sp. 2504JD4-2]